MENHDHLILVKEKYNEDTFSHHLGIVLDELTDDDIMMHMDLRPDMLNLYNRPHGGVIYALADAAFSVIANSRNNISVALDCTITYHNGPDVGQTLYVHGRTLSVSKRVGSYLFDVYCMEDGERKKIATMKGTAFRTGRAIVD